MLDALLYHSAGDQTSTECGLCLGVRRIDLHRLFKQIDAPLVVT